MKLTNNLFTLELKSTPVLPMQLARKAGWRWLAYMTSHLLKRNGKKLAMVSLIGGMFISLLYYFTGNEKIGVAVLRGLW